MSPQSNPDARFTNSDEFNGLANNLNEITAIGAGDSGYGQQQLYVNIIGKGRKVMKKDWMSLFHALQFTAAHQGKTLTTSNLLLDGNFKLTSTVLDNIEDIKYDIDELRSNKLACTLSKMSVQTNLLSSMNTYLNPILFPRGQISGDELWKSDIDNQWFEFRVQFLDGDSRRHYFNSGGEIRISADLDATSFSSEYGPSQQWHLLLERAGSIKLGHNTTESGLAYGTPGIGFTGLTSVYQKVYYKVVAPSPGIDFTGHAFEIWARLCEDSEIDIAVYFLNSADYELDYSGYAGFDGDLEDFRDLGNWVEGELTVSVAQLRADDAHSSQLGVTVESPKYIVLNDLTEILTRPT